MSNFNLNSLKGRFAEQLVQDWACFSALRKKYPTILTTYLASDALSLYDVNMTQNIELVFGNEHTGVSEEVRTPQMVILLF